MLPLLRIAGARRPPPPGPRSRSPSSAQRRLLYFPTRYDLAAATGPARQAGLDALDRPLRRLRRLARAPSRRRPRGPRHRPPRQRRHGARPHLPARRPAGARPAAPRRPSHGVPGLRPPGWLALRGVHRRRDGRRHRPPRLRPPRPPRRRVPRQRRRRPRRGGTTEGGRTPAHHPRLERHRARPPPLPLRPLRPGPRHLPRRPRAPPLRRQGRLPPGRPRRGGPAGPGPVPLRRPTRDRSGSGRNRRRPTTPFRTAPAIPSGARSPASCWATLRPDDRPRPLQVAGRDPLGGGHRRRGLQRPLRRPRRGAPAHQQEDPPQPGGRAPGAGRLLLRPAAAPAAPRPARHRAPAHRLGGAPGHPLGRDRHLR